MDDSEGKWFGSLFVCRHVGGAFIDGGNDMDLSADDAREIALHLCPALADAERERDELRARVDELEEKNRALSEQEEGAQQRAASRALEMLLQADEIAAWRTLGDTPRDVRLRLLDLEANKAGLDVEIHHLRVDLDAARARVSELEARATASSAALETQASLSQHQAEQRAILSAALAAQCARVAELEGMQSRVWRWVVSTFGEATAADVRERSMRFVEEALELAQSVGMSDATAHRLVDFVWGRPAGNPRQEVGGTMVTLLTLAEQHGIDVLAAALTEIARIETPEMVAKCRRHQAQKEAQGMASDTGAESEE